MSSLPPSEYLSFGFDPSPPPPPDESPAESLLPRRDFLKITASLVSSALLASNALGNALPEPPARVEVFDTSSCDAFPHTATLVIPGFNILDTKSIGYALRPTLRQYGPVWLLYPSANNEQTVATLARTCKDNDVHTLNFYGLSEGGMPAMELSARMSADEGIKTGFMFYDCSPEEWRDVKGAAQRVAVELGAFMNKLGIDGGPLAYVPLDMGANLLKHVGIESVTDALGHALQKSKESGFSNARRFAQLRTIATFISTDYTPYLKDVPQCYLSPEDPLRDTVINNPRALGGLRRQLGGVVLHETSPDTIHASPRDYPDQYAGMMARGLQRMDIPTADDVRSRRPSGPLARRIS